MDKPLRVGVSACLLGQNVRYDGGHKRDRYLTDILSRYCTFVPVCPEVECGLGVPREAMRLCGDPEAPRLVTAKSGLDLTGLMRDFALKRIAELAGENLVGYIFKAKSPSCGFDRVKVYHEGGAPTRRGVGLFARAFMDRFPLVPVEDEGRLNDPGLRENCIERIFTLARFRKVLAEDGTGGRLARLVAFQASHKLLFMAHSPELARRLGRLIGTANSQPPETLLADYETLLMRTLALPATPAKHANVLEHIMGYFKKVLTSGEKAELLELITHHRLGNLPLIVPVTLLAHYTRKYDVAYLKDQAYLHPHPLECKLRNHA